MRVTTARQIKNITLIGFMGTGKTTVGRLVAEQLKFEFLDTDALIEERSGKKIADIFAQNGEPAFRELEAQLVEELNTRTKTIISTGGGLPTNPANLVSLKKHSLIFMRLSPSNIIASWFPQSRPISMRCLPIRPSPAA